MGAGVQHLALGRGVRRLLLALHFVEIPFFQNPPQIRGPLVRRLKNGSIGRVTLLLAKTAPEGLGLGEQVIGRVLLVCVGRRPRVQVPQRNVVRKGGVDIP